MKRLSIILIAPVLLVACQKTPPRGAFPQQIGTFQRDGEVHVYDTENLFSALYKSPDGSSVGYKLYETKSPEEATRDLQSEKSWPSSIAHSEESVQTVQESDSRFVDVEQSRGTVIIGQTYGPRLIEIQAPSPATAIEFENNLPYAALGISQPVKHTADEIKVTPVSVLRMLDEFNKDPTAAKKKYNGKVFLLTGTVAGSGKDKKGEPFLAFQRPGTEPSMETNVGASFEKSEETKVLAIKNGEEVRFKGKVSFEERMGLRLLTVVTCRLQ